MRMDDKALKAAMRRMGIQSVEVPATQVIIKSPGRELVISSPSVTKVNMMGQETYQVIGQAQERSSVSEDDLSTVAAQAGVGRDKARAALEKSDGDIAAAIISLQEQKD